MGIEYAVALFALLDFEYVSEPRPDVMFMTTGTLVQVCLEGLDAVGGTEDIVRDLPLEVFGRER